MPFCLFSPETIRNVSLEMTEIVVHLTKREVWSSNGFDKVLDFGGKTTNFLEFEYFHSSLSLSFCFVHVSASNVHEPAALISRPVQGRVVHPRG